MTGIDEIQSIVTEQSDRLAVSLPQSVVHYLLDQKNEADRLREEKRQLQQQVNYYKQVHPATIREVRTLRKELNWIRKEQVDGRKRAQV